MATGMNSTILELRNITKRFGDLVAVNDVSFSSSEEIGDLGVS